MDNQNANNGGFPQGQNPPLDNNQPPIPPNQAAGNLENIRTQSVVESSRDVAEKELAAQEARNNQILKQQQAAARHDKEMHVAVKVVLIIFGILIFLITWKLLFPPAPALYTKAFFLLVPTLYFVCKGFV